MPKYSYEKYFFDDNHLSLLSTSHGEILVKNKEKFYQTLIDSTYDWEELLGPDNRFLYVSPSCERITGYAADEFLDDPRLLESIVHPEDREMMRDHWNEGFHSFRDETHCLDFRIITRDGEIKWINHCCRPLFDNQGAFFGRRGSNWDISVRKKAELELASLAERYQMLSEEYEVSNEELKTQNDELTVYAEKLTFQEKKLHSILSSMEDYVYIVDREGRCRYVNAAVARAAAAEPKELIGISIEGIWRRAGVAMVSIASFRDDLDAAFLTENTQTGENIFRYPEGLRWRNYTIHPLPEENGKRTALVTSRDITAMKDAEAELKRSYRQLMDIIEFLPDATFVLDERQQVIAWNRAMESMTSVPKENMLGKGDYCYAVPFYGEARPMLSDFVITAKRDIAHLYDMFDSGENVMIAETYAPKFNEGNGAHFWAKASVIRDDEGRVIGAIETIRDISERKRAEEETIRRNTELSVMNEKLSTLYEELAETEEELRQNYDEIVKGERALRETTQYLENLIGYANAPIIVWDPEFRITRFNQAFEYLTGKAADRVIGQSLDILFPEESSKKSMDLIQRTSSGERFESVEIPVLGAEGDIRTVLWNSATLYEADGTTVQSVIAQGQDITDRKKTREELIRKNEDLAEKEEELRQNLDELGKSERALRETTQYLENLIGYANAPIIVWDAEFRITRFNRAFELLIGRKAEEVIGKPLDILFPGKCREMNMDLIWKASTGERWETVEIPVITANGEIRTVLWNSATLYEADGTTVRSVIAQGQDITDRKEMDARLRKNADELARSNEELEQFAYVASHDLREPLRMVTSFSQLLQQRYQGRLDADADEFIHYVVEGGKRMDALVNDLLEFSRINSRAKPLQPADMNEVVEDALQGLSVALEESGARIEVEYLPTVPVDRTQMSQIFQNLLSNAIKFRGENMPLIRIWATKNEDEWIFSVQDNGIGIDPSYSETIFEIFKRLHTKEEYPGTGIGLAISRRIIERHGGRIWVTSQIGNGSTFSFTLPAETPVS